MRQVWMVVVAVLLAAIGPSFAQTEVSGPPGEVLASMPAVTSLPISVSFSGTDAEAFRREFMRLAETEGQPVNVTDWGGKYLVLLRGETETNAIAGDVWRLLGRTRVASGIHGIVTWRLTADVKTGSQHLFSESARATGPRGNFNTWSWSSSGGFDANIFNNWLDRSLQGKTVRELVPRIMRRLEELEQSQTASTPPESGRPVAEQAISHQAGYTLYLPNGNPIPIEIASGKRLRPGDSVVFYRQGERIAKYYVEGITGGQDARVRTIFERSRPQAGDPFEIFAGFRYRLVVGPGMEIPVQFSRPIRQYQKIRLFANSRPVGRLTVNYFDLDGERTFVLGDIGIARQPGIAFAPE